MTPYNIFESESIGQKVGLVLGNQQLDEDDFNNWFGRHILHEKLEGFDSTIVNLTRELVSMSNCKGVMTGSVAQDANGLTIESRSRSIEPGDTKVVTDEINNEGKVVPKEDPVERIKNLLETGSPEGFYLYGLRISPRTVPVPDSPNTQLPTLIIRYGCVAHAKEQSKQG